MSRYSGRQGHGAARNVRKLKGEQAEERNAKYQKLTPAERLLRAIFPPTYKFAYGEDRRSDYHLQH
jgi:hypothetical protein